ncbi:MAG: hydrogenase expression/formation protein HypE, partial [Nitrospiria bacterium]
MSHSNDPSLTCPVPSEPYDRILLSHGSGGKQTLQLIEEVFSPAFGNNPSPSRHDGAVLELPSSRIAFTTDSFVVTPLFFPGGDIGSLSVNGTVNDLAMCGAEPLFLSVGFILEEGLPMEILRRVVVSLRKAADDAGVRIVTGDTKVVERGRGHGIYLNTAGIGVLRGGHIGPEEIAPGDQILLSGDIGRHGIAVLGEREGLSFETPV